MNGTKFRMRCGRILGWGPNLAGRTGKSLGLSKRTIYRMFAGEYPVQKTTIAQLDLADQVIRLGKWPAGFSDRLD